MTTNARAKDHMKLQLSLIHGRETRDVKVRFPTVQKQSVGSNLCGPLVCGFMADIVSGKSPEKTLFRKEVDQRQWLLEVLQNEKLSVCPKKGAGRRPLDALTAVKPEITITPADAANFRASLSKDPILDE